MQARARRDWCRSARDRAGERRGRVLIPYFYTVLADVSAHLGHTEDGLQALAEAHTLVEPAEDAGGKRKFIASGASCSYGRWGP